MNIQTQGRLTTPEQFGNIALRANPDGSLLRVTGTHDAWCGALARIMHHLPRFFLPGPDAYCTRTPSIRPVWIGVRQLAVQLVWV